jgi:chromosome segregation ATPase
MRWANFFQRKAKDMPIEIVKAVEPDRDELEELQTAITLHQGRLNAMATEAERLESQLGRIAALSSQLKVRCSEHDAGAPAQLDALEQEKIAIERQQEGLRLRISSLQSELAPMTREASTLASQRDLARQDALVKKCEVEKDALIEEILSNWTRCCEAAFDLMVMLDGGMNGQLQLDDEHRRQLFAMNTIVGERLQAAALVTVNEPSQFQFARREVFRQLRIIPARRKQRLRAAG